MLRIQLLSHLPSSVSGIKWPWHRSPTSSRQVIRWSWSSSPIENTDPERQLTAKYSRAVRGYCYLQMICRGRWRAFSATHSLTGAWWHNKFFNPTRAHLSPRLSILGAIFDWTIRTAKIKKKKRNQDSPWGRWLDWIWTVTKLAIRAAVHARSTTHHIKYDTNYPTKKVIGLMFGTRWRDIVILYNACNKVFSKFTRMPPLRYHLTTTCKLASNRCTTPFELTLKRPQFKSHRSRGTSKIWSHSTDVWEFFAKQKDGSRRCNLCGQRFGSKAGWSTVRYHLRVVCGTSELVW